MKRHLIVLILASFALGGSAVLIGMSAIYEERSLTLVASSLTLVGMLGLTISNFKILVKKFKDSELEN